MLKIVETQCDLLIIGSGGAALYAALLVADSDLRIVLASKAHPMQSSTAIAQGGISAALASVEEDRYQWHIYDTLQAAHGLADVDSVEYMCKMGERVIANLAQFGVNFNRDEQGRIRQKKYGGHTKHYGAGGLAHRTCYSNDGTGEAIISALYSRLMDVFSIAPGAAEVYFRSMNYRSSLCFLNHHFAVDLIRCDEYVLGCVFFDLLNLRIHIVWASNVIIASGGYTKLYPNSTSCIGSTGDGHAIAARSGIGLQDMEFVQFHPTILYGTSILVSEAARAAGGVLINSLGQQFMRQYSPQFLELSTRDVVSKAMMDQIHKGFGCGVHKDHILLDLRMVQDVAQKLPNLMTNCELLKINPQKDPVPVVPGVHYGMGGIALDSLCRAQCNEHHSMQNLYVLGEAGCASVHGAQRLGCNSLLECYAFGHLVVERILTVEGKVLDTVLYQELKQTAIAGVNLDIKRALALPMEEIEGLWNDLQGITQQHLGFIKNEDGIKHAIEQINHIDNLLHKNPVDIEETRSSSLQHRLAPRVIVKYLELKNALVCALAIAHSALARPESRGAYVRIDYPDKNDELMYHSFYDYHRNKVYYKKVRAVSQAEC